MKFSLHYSIFLVAATVACVAAAPATDIVQEKDLSVAHQLEVASNKLDQGKAVIAQKKTAAENGLETAKALADKLKGEADTARESATGFKETAAQTRQTVVTSLGDAVNAYTSAKERYEMVSGTDEFDNEVLQNLKNKHENALSAINANSIERNGALIADSELDLKEKAADDAKRKVDDYALSIEQLTEVDNKISQKEQALAEWLSACVDDLECSIKSIIGDNIDEINTAENEIDPTLTGSDPNQVKEDKGEEGQVDKDKTGTANGKAKTADDNDAEDIVDDLEVNKKAAKESDSKMKVGKEEEREMEVSETKITEQEAPEDKAAEKKKLKEIAAENETAENEIDPTLTGSDPNQVKEDKGEEGQVDKDKTGTANGKAKTADDNDAEDIVDDLEVNKKAAKESDSKMKVGKEEEREMEVSETKITEQEAPEDKAAEKKKLKEIAAEKEKKEKRVKDAAREAAEKKAEEVAKEEKASEKVNKIKKDKAAKKDEEAEVVAEEGEATENDETKGVDKTVQEEKAGESGEKKGEDKTKNAVVQGSGAIFNQPAVAVGILSVMFALAFGV